MSITCHAHTVLLFSQYATELKIHQILFFFLHFRWIHSGDWSHGYEAFKMAEEKCGSAQNRGEKKKEKGKNIFFSCCIEFSCLPNQREIGTIAKAILWCWSATWLDSGSFFPQWIKSIASWGTMDECAKHVEMRMDENHFEMNELNDYTTTMTLIRYRIAPHFHSTSSINVIIR